MSKSNEIKRKIKSIRSTQKITFAMQMLSANKMKKAQKVVCDARPFVTNIIEIINNINYNYNTPFPHMFFQETAEKNIGLLVISTDRGLCGGLNINLLRKCIHWIESLQFESDLKPQFKLATIGEKAKLFVAKRLRNHIIASEERIGEHPTIQKVIGVIQVLLQEYKKLNINSIYIAYNKFVNTMQQIPIIEKLLPIVPEKIIKPNKLPTDYLFEPSASRLLDLLLDRYIESLIYQRILENIASEQSARMIAMKNATDNASEIIESLNLNYNKERQTLITKEIAEIVSGSNAI